MIKYTQVGGTYEKSAIDEAIKRVKWVTFQTEVPFAQGECIKLVCKGCKIPLSKAQSFDLHGYIKDGTETHGFYALDIQFKNGNEKIYIADSGCESCVVAYDFEPTEKDEA